MKETALRNWLTAAMLLPACAAGAAESAPASTDTPNPPAAVRLPVSAVNEYQAEIGRLESRFGPYDPQLGEQLLSLGLVYQRLGQYPDSTKSLARSLHIKRINEGLQSLNQLPILEELIESSIAAEDWQELDRNYDLLLWVHRRNYGNGDPSLLPIIDKVGRWKLNAFVNRLLDQEPENTLDDAEDLYDRSVKILEKQFGPNDPRLVDSLYGKALTNYRIAGLVANKPLSEFRAAASVPIRTVRYVQQCTVVRGRRICQMVPVASYETFDSTMDKQRARDMAIRQRISNAGVSLRRIVEIHDAHPELGPESQAKALVNRGDFDMRYGNATDAIERYRRAYQLLAGSGAKQEDIDAYFGTPKQIPTLRLPLSAVENQQDQGPRPDYVVATMDVSSKGKSRNVEIVEESNPQNMGIRRKAKEQLKLSRYRPRFENGEPVDTSGYRLTIMGP